MCTIAPTSSDVFSVTVSSVLARLIMLDTRAIRRPRRPTPSRSSACRCTGGACASDAPRAALARVEKWARRIRMSKKRLSDAHGRARSPPPPRRRAARWPRRGGASPRARGGHRPASTPAVASSRSSRARSMALACSPALPRAPVVGVVDGAASAQCKSLAQRENSGRKRGESSPRRESSVQRGGENETSAGATGAPTRGRWRRRRPCRAVLVSSKSRRRSGSGRERKALQKLRCTGSR